MSETTLASPQFQMLNESRQTTLAALTRVDDGTLAQLSRLSLPEIRSIQQEIAQVLPAGNLPAFVLSGLIQLQDRVISSNRVSQDLAALMRGVGLVPQGLYGLFVAGPAAVLYAYQKILQLAGKDADSAFPQGMWQSYLQFGLREDTARHASETAGFHHTLSPTPLTVPPDAAMAAAWLCAALELLYTYDELLAADWSERVMLRQVAEEAAWAGKAGHKPFDTLAADWTKARPYHRASDDNYVPQRQAAFQHFIQPRLKALPGKARASVERRYQERAENELAAYQTQMTILAALEPDRYEERKLAIPLWQACVAFVWQGHTFLLPACQCDERGSPLCFPLRGKGAPMPLYALNDGSLCDAERRPLRVDRSGRVYGQADGQLAGQLRPPAPETVKSWATAILSVPAWGNAPSLDLRLAPVPRAAQADARQGLPEAARAELAALRRAPIILNWDAASRAAPLAVIRRNRRGLGDHALTIFRTEASFVLDQSHIFFDGMWGMAVAEVMTDSAIHWYRRVVKAAVIPTATPGPLALSLPSEVEAKLAARVRPGEASAESSAVDAPRLFKLCKLIRQRGVRLTVNDVLLLYRFFHSLRYEPSRAVQSLLQALRDRAYLPGVRAASDAIAATLARFKATNPALLIPMDASNVSPRERIFPTTFRNPLTEIHTRWAETQRLYLAYRTRRAPEEGHRFDQARREFLAYLKAFGETLDALKAVTMRGESFNAATLRLTAHLPGSMKYLLDQVPQRIGVLNEIIKGSEVFSNVGRVAPGSSLTRFISAKDDGESKELVWGVLTDDGGQMHISLRDFRPFVPLLLALGESALADALAQDYLDSYVHGLNEFVAALSDVIADPAR